MIYVILTYRAQYCDENKYTCTFPYHHHNINGKTNFLLILLRSSQYHLILFNILPVSTDTYNFKVANHISITYMRSKRHILPSSHSRRIRYYHTTNCLSLSIYLYYDDNPVWIYLICTTLNKIRSWSTVGITIFNVPCYFHQIRKNTVNSDRRTHNEETGVCYQNDMHVAVAVMLLSYWLNPKTLNSIRDTAFLFIILWQSIGPVEPLYRTTLKMAITLITTQTLWGK